MASVRSGKRRGSGVAPILQTETPTVGKVISGNSAQSLPLNGRNIGQLALLLTGTTTYNPRGFTNIGAINMNRPFVNGNREQTNKSTVDGFDVNETIEKRMAFQPIPDAACGDQRRKNDGTGAALETPDGPPGGLHAAAHVCRRSR